MWWLCCMRAACKSVSASVCVTATIRFRLLGACLACGVLRVRRVSRVWHASSGAYQGGAEAGWAQENRREGVVSTYSYPLQHRTARLLASAQTQSP